MQLRRVLLLFALVLGLSAVVAGLAPPPEKDSGRSADEPASTTPTLKPVRSARTERVSFNAREAGADKSKTSTKAVTVGSSLAVQVSVPEPGDVAIDELGLRQSAEPRAAARFDLLGPAAGVYSVVFLPVAGEPRLVGRLKAVPPKQG